MHDALVEFIRSGGETEVKDVNVSQYVRQLTTQDDNSDTPLHKQYQVLSHERKYHVSQKQVVRFRTQTALPRSVTVSILRMTVCTISDNESNIV